MNELTYATNHQRLQNLMQQAGISSLEELSRHSGVSRWQLLRLQYGLLGKMRVDFLLQLCQVLQVPLPQFLSLFYRDPLPAEVGQGDELAELKQEYRRLEQQLAGQQQDLQQQFQRTVLDTLESLLLQWPTAAAAAVQNNPQLSAANLMPLLAPLTELLEGWGIEPLAAVGEEVPYDPQWHQLLAGTAQPGEPVKVRYVGYRQGDKLLYRAQVMACQDLIEA